MIHRMATTPDDVAADLARGLALPEVRRDAYNRLRAAEKRAKGKAPPSPE
jgi:hypothetical protein